MESRRRPVILLALVALTNSVNLTKGADEVCYTPLGCFSTEPPFGISLQRPLVLNPQSPGVIGTVFKLFTRESPSQSIDLPAIRVDNINDVWTGLKVRPVKFIVHGFLEDTDKDSWLRTLKTEILLQGYYHVIIVDWSEGNKPPYTLATANTRVVGAQIAHLIQKLEESFGIQPSDMHIIGHSLGSHIAGYAGERTYGRLGRITGLDPAGPYFENTDIRVRLDPSDARFVDVIHTDGRSLLVLGLGTLQPMGHYDFYPNLGHEMPGCQYFPIKDILELGMRGAAREGACNHARSVKYFIESVNVKCPYTAYPCSGEEDFVSGKCRTCSTQGCARMGFHAKPINELIQKYYLTTSDSEPFCQYHWEVFIKLSSQPTFSEKGIIEVNVATYSGVIKSVKSSNTPISLTNNQVVHVSLIDPVDIGSIATVSVRWKKEFSILDTLGGWFGKKPKKIYIDAVGVYSAENNEKVIFCARDEALEDDKTTLLLTQNQIC
ncbi:triacylglycerol lipase [Biomphalaria glabrata]|nr:triacylglycerol lipase [Biomphalaria glabrata]